VASFPLVVDLDGTLINTDMLNESALKILQQQPINALRMPIWLCQGISKLKEKLAELTHFDPTILPYNKQLLEWLKQQKSAGRKLILCTASNQAIAKIIAQHLAIFDEVIASDETVNLKGSEKAKALKQKFGRAGFDYVGNSKDDLAVWQCARRAIVVNGPYGLAKKIGKICEIEHIFPAKALNFNTWCRMLRAHQWLKNLLLFMPIIAAHQIPNIDTSISLISSFIAFSLCASALYIMNDLLDLESDRLHPRKHRRPFASGQASTTLGIFLAPLLLFLSFQLGAYIHFLPWLLLYFILTSLYSLGLKRIVLVDCLILAMLYTLRIVSGAAVIHLSLSFWLLAFSVFLFLSLAFVKRYAELALQSSTGKQKTHGRGYETADASIIQSMGITSGYASVLVLALYLNSAAVLVLYRTPEFVWGAVPIMLFWISWIWLQAHRGKMHDDPLIFAIKNKVSLWSGATFMLVLAIGTVGWPW